MKLMFGAALAAVVSFGIVVGVSKGDLGECAHLAADCPGWGTEEPKIDGYCCIEKYSATEECGTGIKSVLKALATYCGKLAVIENFQCGQEISTGCGAMKGEVGCTTAYCPE